MPYQMDHSRCNVDFFDDHWAIVRDLLFEEYAAVCIVGSMSRIDLMDDDETTLTIYAVHNAQLRCVSKTFRAFFEAKSSELIWRREPFATHIHGTFVHSNDVAQTD